MPDIQAVQKQLESFRSAQERLNTITQQLQQTLDSGEMRIKMSAILEMLAASLGLIGQGSALVAALGAAEEEKAEASAKNPVAKKTAAKWIAQYGSLDEIVAHAEEITGKIGEYLREGIPFLETARRLVTINCEAPVEAAPESLRITAPDEEKLAAFYVRWEMRSGAARAKAAPKKPAQAPATADLFALVPGDAAPESVQAAPLPGEARVAATPEALKELAAALEAAAESRFPVAVSVLSDRVRPMADRPAGLAFAVTPAAVWYVPLGHKADVNAQAADVREFLGPWFAGGGAKVFHDAKYAVHVLANYGLAVAGPIDDSMLMSYVLEAHLKHDITKIAARTLSTAQPELDALMGRGAQKAAAGDIKLADAAPFMTRMSAVLRSAASVMLAHLGNAPELARIYREVELPVMRVLGTMERTGVALDVAKLNAQSEELAGQIDAVTVRIHEAAGESFNPSSPKQLAHILFEKLGLPVRKKTSSGGYSTDEEVLSELALDYPLPKLILEYRSLTKLKSTYTDKLPQMVEASDGRVHTTFGQATAVTGRLASSEPNLQNIPVRTPEGRRVREAFTAPAGCSIVSADYSQIELRIMAHLSGDAGLIEAFRQGRDIHRATAAEVFGTTLEAVTPEQRRMAKVINFGLIYGMSAFGLAQNLGLSRSVAGHYIEQYFARYPGVRAYMDNTRQMARSQGWVQTAFGRRLWLPDILSTRPAVRAGAERAAINAPMQGTAADLIKFAMVAVQKWLEENRMQSRMVLQVHDELVLEVPEAELAVVKEKLPELMASVAALSVPLVAEVGVGPNWEAAH